MQTRYFHFNNRVQQTMSYYFFGYCSSTIKKTNFKVATFQNWTKAPPSCIFSDACASNNRKKGKPCAPCWRHVLFEFSKSWGYGDPAWTYTYMCRISHYKEMLKTTIQCSYFRFVMFFVHYQTFNVLFEFDAWPDHSVAGNKRKTQCQRIKFEGVS